MLRAISFALLGCVTTQAEALRIPIHGKLATILVEDTKDAVLLRKELLSTESSTVIPQIASSGSFTNGFATFFAMTALTSQPASVLVEFFGGNGQSMNMPGLQPNPDGTPCIECPPVFGPGFAGNLLPGQALSQFIIPDGAARVGYARISSSPPASVAVTASFWQFIPGRPLFMTGVPPSYELHRKAFMYTVDAGGFTSSMALVAARESTYISLRFRSSSLAVQCVSSFFMPSGTHTAFLMKDRLRCIVGQEGAVEIQGTNFAGVGIWAHDEGAFVTQPLMEK